MRAGAEPFRAKIVEPLTLSTRAERSGWARDVHYNLFGLSSERVIIDLLTDSGTGALSDNQWAGLFLGDESYAGSVNFIHLRDTVTDLFGYEYVLPTHQGRGAENLLLGDVARQTREAVMAGRDAVSAADPMTPGADRVAPEDGSVAAASVPLYTAAPIVVGNTHFDTTRAHIGLNGLRAVDLPIPEAAAVDSDHSFKGDMDVAALEQLLEREGAAAVGCIIMTVTNNAVGGQPVSLANLRAVSAVARKHGIPLFLDAARFAENAWFIKQREPGYAQHSVTEIVRLMAAAADGCLVSAKKDGLVNIGGFVALREEDRYERLVPMAVAYEGFVTYGGLAGRDMEALARGLRTVVQHEYLAERTGQVAAFGECLAEAGIPVLQPFGGHAVYVDAGRFLPHIEPSGLPAQALAVQLYIEGGIRAVEVGTVMAGRDAETGEHIHPALELLRLAIPRRVYTDEHLQYVAEMLQYVWRERDHVRAMNIVAEPPILRHFTAQFAWRA